MNDASPYTKGSLLKHVVSATMAGSLGLIAMFGVDFIDIYFIGILGEPALAAAVGFAATVTFFSTSIAIGLSIALGVVLGAEVGANNIERAREIQSNSFGIIIAIALPISIIVWIFADTFLIALGARGHTLELAISYLRTVIMGYPFLACGIACSGALRAMGLNANAAYLIMTAAILNGVLDPIFIFGFNLGLKGAALATVVAQLGMAISGFFLLSSSPITFVRPNFTNIVDIAPELSKVAGPAILANLATPVGSAYITRLISDFGDDAIAGFAVVGRLTPIAFAFVFALSGAVGPIIAQNLGAHLYDRVRQTILYSMLVSLIYTLIVTAILILLEPYIIAIFPLSDRGKELVDWFCGPVSLLWVFNAFLFIANASFNNLKHPIYSTITNWTRQTLFTIPFASFFSLQMGAVGVLVGPAIGGIFVAVAAISVALKLATNTKVAAMEGTPVLSMPGGDLHSARFGDSHNTGAKK